MCMTKRKGKRKLIHWEEKADTSWEMIKAGVHSTTLLDVVYCLEIGRMLK